MLRDGTTTEALELGENEPHPMTGLFSALKLIAGLGVDRVLRLNESLLTASGQVDWHFRVQADRK